MKTNRKNILQNIVFYTLLLQGSPVLSSAGVPHCFPANPRRALPSLPQTKEREQAKKNAFNSLLEQADNLNLSDILGLDKNNQSKESGTNSIEPFISEQPPSIPHASIRYYQRFSPQPSNANELIISNDVIPQTFLKRYNEKEPLISLSLHHSDINLLEQIYHEAKKSTEDPLSFIITIDDQSYGIHYLTFNNDCRSLGEQIPEPRNIESPDHTNYSLYIDQNNIVTLEDKANNASLLLRCTDFQLNHITTTNAQFYFTLLGTRYTIKSINNNGIIKQLLIEQKTSYEQRRSDVSTKPEATEEEKENYRKLKEQLGLPTTTTSTNSVPATPQPEEQKHVIPQRWVLIGGIGASIVAIATLIYFFLATYTQHQ